MNDPQRMRLGDGDARLQNEVDGLLDRHRAALAHPRPEVSTLEKLHDHVWGAVGQGPHVEHASDVLAGDLDGCAGLPRKAGYRFLILHHGWKKEFDGDCGVELQVASGYDD